MEGHPPEVVDDRVARARRGDARAYESLVQEYQNIAYRTAYVITRSAADAEDATQEAFVKAYRALGRFRHGAPFRPWLLRIVANEAHNHPRLRHPARAARAARRGAEHASGGAAPSPEAATLAADEREHLAGRAIETLPEPDQLWCFGLPLLPGAERGGDGRGAGLRARYRQVAHVARARPAAGAPRGGRRVNELETRLSALGRDLAFPDTPDFSVSVPRALEESERRQRVPFWRTLAIAAALVLVPAAAVFAFSEQARDRLGELLGLRAVEIEHVKVLPNAPQLGTRLELGEQVASVEEAEEQVGFIVQVPEALGEPGAIYVRRVGGVPEVNMVWPPGPGLPRTSQTGVGALLTQLRGDIEPGMLGKAVTEQVRSA